MGERKVADVITIQDLVDGRLDVKGMATFYNGAAGLKVPRRLADDIETLEYYLEYMRGLEAVYAQPSGMVEVNGVQIKPVKVALDDALNAAVIGGGGLADTAVAVTATTPDMIARTLSSVLSERVSVKTFGAKGDNNQTLYATNYQSDNVSQPITITQQTADGIALNRAIKYLRSKGGGAMYIPSGTYRIYGYLERIDFPCVFYGDGAASVIKNCDNSPTDKNGYGAFHIQPSAISEITLMNFKIDGNAHTRTKPTSEWRVYNIHACGYLQLRMFNVTIVSPK